MTIAHRPTASGYTLIEIVVVIAILGIVSAIAIPQFAPRDDLKTASAAREITADLLFAQSQAIALGKPVYIAFDETGYRLLDSLFPEHLLRHPTTQTPYQVHYASTPLHGITLHPDFDAAPTLAFDSTGAPAVATPESPTVSPLLHGAITITSGQSTLTLTLEPITGAINVR